MITILFVTGVITWLILLYCLAVLFVLPLIYSFDLVFAELYSMYKNKRLKMRHFFQIPKALVVRYFSILIEGVPTRILSSIFLWEGLFKWQVIYKTANPVEVNNKQW